MELKLTEVVSVKFRARGKSYYFDPGALTVTTGDNVVVETAKGPEFGECTAGNFELEDDKVILPLRPVLRIATEEDRRIAERTKAKEAEAFKICSKKIAEHKLDMKLVDVEYNFEGSKLLFFFTSDGRVDFRELVKDLAAIFRTRIELRQIGVRDEARMLGGLGICGRQFCCSQFLGDFHPVSIKMAKTQNLSLNPTKISGTCGRLMCCLKYEQDAYEELVKNAPKVDSYVETPEGNGTITAVNLLRGSVKVRMDNSADDPVLSIFPIKEINFIKTGKQRRLDLAGAAKDAAPSPAPGGKGEPAKREESGKPPQKSVTKRNPGKKEPSNPPGQKPKSKNKTYGGVNRTNGQGKDKTAGKREKGDK